MQPTMRERLDELIHVDHERLQKEAGLTPEKIYKTVVEGLDATLWVTLGSGERARFEVAPDWRARLAASKQGAELLGLIAPKKVDHRHRHSLTVALEQLEADRRARMQKEGELLPPGDTDTVDAEFESYTAEDSRGRVQ